MVAFCVLYQTAVVPVAQVAVKSIEPEPQTAPPVVADGVAGISLICRVTVLRFAPLVSHKVGFVLS